MRPVSPMSAPDRTTTESRADKAATAPEFSVPGAARSGIVRRGIGAVLPWVISMIIVLVALRATWGVPLQGDDFWLLFSIHASEAGAWVNSIDFTTSWIAHGTHFNPIGYFLDALLKGGMLATTSPIVTPSVIHHGAIALFSMLTMVAVSSLLSRLLALTSRIEVAASTCAVPVALGFLAATQLTALWSNYDPLVTHPIYASLTTLVGFAYLAAALGATRSDPDRQSVVAAATLGVTGFLIYELFIVFAASLGVILIVYGRSLPWSRLRDAGLWMIGVPLLSLVVARVFVASHETVTYSGTEMAIGWASVPALVTSTYTSAPGSLWGATGGAFDPSLVGPFALGAAALAGTTFFAWAFTVRHRDNVVMGEAPTSRSALRGLGPVGVIAIMAPVPFALSGYWVQVLAQLGQTYMHSLIQIWTWSMVVAILALEVVRRRWSVLAILSVGVVLTLWVGIQVNVNRQVAERIEESPRLGIDVTAALEGLVPESDEERCALLVAVEASGMYDSWDLILNREFEEVHGEPFCTKAD